MRTLSFVTAVTKVSTLLLSLRMTTLHASAHIMLSLKQLWKPRSLICIFYSIMFYVVEKQTNKYVSYCGMDSYYRVYIT